MGTTMTATQYFKGRLAALARMANFIAGIALLGTAAAEIWQVFARYVLNHSPGWTEPVALFLLNTAMSLGAAAAVRSWSHFGFFILVHQASAPLRRALEVFACGVVALVGLALAVWGAQLLLDGIGIALAGVRLPQSAVFAPMALGGALMALFALERIVTPGANPTMEH
ncbi:MAG: TRAP transporter small permease [Gammaproteobacteria bacterium]|nr:MAG: TRAP transporter small permease [Gammaproteobacteria bacterium]